MLNAFTSTVVALVLQCAIIVGRIEELLRHITRVARSHIDVVICGIELEALAVVSRDDLRRGSTRWNGHREVPTLIGLRLVTAQHICRTSTGSNAHVVIWRGCFGAQGEPAAGAHLELWWSSGRGHGNVSTKTAAGLGGLSNMSTS